MNVQEIMTQGLDQIDSDQNVMQAAKIMAKDDVGCLAVSQQGKIIGILSDRDIVVNGLAKGTDPGQLTVGQIMHGDPVCCHTSDQLETAARLMKEHKLRRLIVSDENEIPVGCISIGDIASRAHNPELCGEVLEDVCAGHATRV